MSVFGADWYGISAVVSTLAVVSGCTILGAQIGLGRERIAGTDTMVGLGLGGGLLSIFAATTSVPLSVWLVILGMGVAAGSIRLIRHRVVPGGKGFWVAAAMLTPFLAIAAAAPAT